MGYQHQRSRVGSTPESADHVADRRPYTAAFRPRGGANDTLGLNLGAESEFPKLTKQVLPDPRILLRSGRVRLARDLAHFLERAYSGKLIGGGTCRQGCGRLNLFN